MSTPRRITMQVFGVVMLLGGAAFAARGLHAVLRPDVTCGDIVMQVGDYCRNRGGRGGGWYLLDYAGQRRHLHEDALLALGMGGAAALFGLVFLFTPRWTKAGTAAVPRPGWRLVGYALPTVPAIGIALGEYLTGDVGWPILLLIPVVVATAPLLVKTVRLDRERRAQTDSAPPG